MRIAEFHGHIVCSELYELAAEAITLMHLCLRIRLSVCAPWYCRRSVSSNNIKFYYLIRYVCVQPVHRPICALVRSEPDQ